MSDSVCERRTAAAAAAQAAHPNTTTIQGQINEGEPWTPAQWDPAAPAAPWWSYSAGDKSESITTMMTRFWRLSQMQSNSSNATLGGRAAMARNMIRVVEALPVGLGIGVMIPKAQAGISPALQAEFNATSLNPVLLDVAGTMLIMAQLPFFEQLPPSSAYLRRVWDPAVPQSNCAGLRQQLPMYAASPEEAAEVSGVCEAGAGAATGGGNESAAALCFELWQARLIPRFQQQMDEARAVLDEVLPNADPATGEPFSGAYFSETDYWQQDFAEAYWGRETYARLLRVKAQYDPQGLFVCHKCVGSEYWTEDSGLNCRNKSMPWPPQ